MKTEQIIYKVSGTIGGIAVMLIPVLIIAAVWCDKETVSTVIKALMSDLVLIGSCMFIRSAFKENETI